MESRGDQEIVVSPAARTVAVIVGIEEYQYSKPPYVLQGVKYAEADASEFASTVKTQFHVDDDDLELWINQQATRTRFENDLPYLASSLGPNDRLIFYYAGHGFYANGANRLTVWDSHPTSLPTTTVCLREVLLSHLQKSRCSQALLFIDACAVPLEENFQGRDVLSELDRREFEEFVQSRNYQALFMSCSPGEKSFPSKTLGHGIWTWFLLQALNGKAPSALYREEWLTDASLRDYLRNEVEKFVREKAKIRSRQRPYSLINAENTFEILRFSKEDLAIDHLSVVKLVTEKAFLTKQGAGEFLRIISGTTMSCDPEELRVLADDVKDVVEARFPYNQYEDFLEEQHGKGRLIFKLDPSIQPGRIEVEISCSRSLRSLNIKLIRLNKPVTVKEFSVSNVEAGQPNEILLRDLGEWLQLL
jgi:hypothetical protein